MTRLMTEKEWRERWVRKGAKARAAALTPEKRREIAKIAAAARWSKSKKVKP